MRVVSNTSPVCNLAIIGLLAEERMAGNLASLEDEIRRLRDECRFFVSADLELRLLHGVGER